MRYSKDKTINDVVRQLLKGEWKIKSNNRHLRLCNSVTNEVLTVPGSPSDKRAVMNWISQVKNSYGIVPC